MNFPIPWPIKFAEKDPLPGSEDQFPRLNEDDLGTSHETGLDMGWGIPFHVAIPVLKGNDLVQLHDHILYDAWVRIFIDRYSSGGMRDKDDAAPIFHSRFFYSLLDPTGHIDEFGPR
jgi:hypothetical protein